MAEAGIRDVLKPFGNLFRMGAVWLAGRGLTTSALLVATAFMGGNPALVPLIPAIVLPISLLVSSVNTQLTFRNREQKLLQTYRKEIGAALGMEPEKVTTEHLHLVAEGSRSLNLKPNKVIKEAIEQNESRRMNSLISNGVSVLLSIGLMMNALEDGSGLNKKLHEFFGEGKNIFGVKNSIFAASLISGATNFLMSTGLGELGRYFFHLNKPTMDGKIRDMMRQKHRGIELQPEQVMELYVAARPELRDAVEQHYHVAYDKLPPHEQRHLVSLYDERLGITRMTGLLNEGRVEPTELAFAAQGEQSGVPVLSQAEAEGGKAQQKARQQEPGLALGAEDGKVMEMYLQPVNDYANPQPSPAIQRILEAGKSRAGQTKSFVERLRNQPTGQEAARQQIVDRVVDDVATEDMREGKKSFTMEVGKEILPEFIGR
jgi:hypothetical protein